MTQVFSAAWHGSPLPVGAGGKRLPPPPTHLLLPCPPTRAPASSSASVALPPASSCPHPAMGTRGPSPSCTGAAAPSLGASAFTPQPPSPLPRGSPTALGTGGTRHQAAPGQGTSQPGLGTGCHRARSTQLIRRRVESACCPPAPSAVAASVCGAGEKPLSDFLRAEKSL